MKRQQFLTMFIIGALVLLGVALSDPGQKIGQQLGSVVGMYASVEPNEYNTLAQQIKEKQEELDTREKKITEKELLSEQQEIPKRDSVAIIYITLIGLLLLVLVLLNFILDWRRRK